MPADLSIRVFNQTGAASHSIDFYQAENQEPGWEKKLLARIQELLQVFRSLGGGDFRISIEWQTKDFHNAVFQINKLTAKEYNVQQEKLTSREVEVLTLIMQGYTNQQIADHLFIGYETVKSHRKNILHKTGVNNTAALINYYHQTFFDK